MGSKSNESKVVKAPFLLMVEVGCPQCVSQTLFLSCTDETGESGAERIAL